MFHFFANVSNFKLKSLTALLIIFLGYVLRSTVTKLKAIQFLEPDAFHGSNLFQNLYDRHY